MSDVIHPSHYNKDGRKECWDEMIDIFGENSVLIFDVLNAYKYYYRRGLKEGNTKDQDTKKIMNYIRHAEELNKRISDNEFVCLTKMKQILESEE